MQFRTVSLLALATLGLSGGVMLTAQAKTGYHRTKTTTIKTKAFYSTSKHGVTYRANGSLTNFKFKKNHALKNYRDSTWVATSKTYIKIHGKNRLYYYVRNSNRKTQGWVWHGYLKPGKHNQMRRQDTKATGQYVVAKPGKLYQFGSVYGSKGFDPFNVRFNKGVRLSEQVTYNRAQTWTIFKHGKKSTYYYVTTSDKQIKGWVWHGFLKPGKAEATSDKPTENVKPGNTSTNNNNMNSKPTVNPSPAPTNPVQKPEPSVPAWTTDDGKRDRMVIDPEEFSQYIWSGHSYSLGVSLKSNRGERQVVTDFEKKLDTSDPYSIHYRIYGTIAGKKTPLDYIRNSILMNGDIFYYNEDEFYVAASQPELTKEYLHDRYANYKTWAPTWYQYNVTSNDFAIWRFNLKTRHWDKVQDHKVNVTAN